MTEKEMIEIKHGSENMADLLTQEQVELKKAMIKELAHTLYCKQDKFDLSNPFEVAKAVVEEGYRKIPEGAVVLTREEYGDLLKGVHTHNYTAMFDNAQAHRIVELENRLCHASDQARKETAREILEWLVEKLKDNVDGQNVDFFVDVKKFAEEIAKQIGVEVEE